MKDSWSLIESAQAGGEGLDVSAAAHAESLWFAGHFPGQPILPGVALVETACQAIRDQAALRNENAKISALRRVRFTRPVLPGERFSIRLQAEKPGDQQWFSFKVMVEDAVVCSGQIAVIKAEKNNI
ncbi:MAG TPA: FabA/FabZ family ACP-dehydratase [Smithellaceae bacterium]|nr:FabA/FabZ family ACP-dehydratase [Smithellaceae bacterium]